ncbi:MAG: cupredoxin domain-containing protein [Actinomycetota bacterium]
MEGVLEVRRGAPFVRVERVSGPDVVAIQDFSFSPATSKVRAGTEVTWRNADPTDHTVSAVDGAFGSDALASGQVFSFRFDERGTFAYRCTIHPDMKGRVQVE